MRTVCAYSAPPGRPGDLEVFQFKYQPGCNSPNGLPARSGSGTLKPTRCRSVYDACTMDAAGGIGAGVAVNIDALRVFVGLGCTVLVEVAAVVACRVLVADFVAAIVVARMRVGVMVDVGALGVSVASITMVAAAVPVGMTRATATLIGMLPIEVGTNRP
jgi:hypothetical protein